MEIGPPIEGVRMPDGKILIFDGHHRLAALELAKETKIPIRVRDYTEIPEEGMRLMLKIGEKSGFYPPSKYPPSYKIPDLGPTDNWSIDYEAEQFLKDSF